MNSVSRIEQATGVASLKDPEYTGPNRCWPCTLSNLGIAAVLTAGVGAAATRWVPATGVAGPAAATVAAVSLAVIYLRGYLVPGTPRLTRRYFPAWLLDWFGKEPERPPAAVDPRETLVSMGVLVDDPAADDVMLDSAFAAAWRERIDAHWNDEDAVRATIGDFAGVPPGSIEFESYPGMLVAYDGPERIASWESRPACVADAAAAATLPAFDPEWERRPLAVRAELLGALRLFVEECPACGGQVSLRTEVVESCCSSRDVVAATCDSCGARLFEVDAPPDLLAAE
ncbi:MULTISPECIES: hypothetical protein [Halolamina]|uniref:Uncharacterized protein n=1 Tax=Halolamina pelagica TaxID=699431 RepID=A0A1I5Q962_9EURY|nr:MULTISPECIES: hypothetical protein [Halolamina]NHX35161.1 hypothetical protein [Halolamina sp. R1-12]SFP42878.1 hypothetical protein SAMN05216277_103320 [Halolamina pelagica]